MSPTYTVTASHHGIAITDSTHDYPTDAAEAFLAVAASAGAVLPGDVYPEDVADLLLSGELVTATGPRLYVTAQLDAEPDGADEAYDAYRDELLYS